MAKQAKNVPAKAEATEGAVTLTPEQLALYERDAGRGLQNVTGADLLIPRLTILQALSPQVNPRHANHIEGAKPGDICDVSTQELFEAPLPVLPVLFDKKWIEWAPRASGKGLVAIHDTDVILQHTTKNDKGQHFTKDGNSVDLTMQFYILNLAAFGRRSFVPMSRTNIKVAKQWVSAVMDPKINSIVLPDGRRMLASFWFKVWNLDVVERTNTQGTWFVWKASPLQPLGGYGEAVPPYSPDWRSYYDDAAAFERSLLAGELKGDMQNMEEQPEDERGPSGGYDESERM